MDALLNAGLRVLLVGLGAGALVGLGRTLVALRRGERWTARLALGLAASLALYAAGHARLLAERDALEAARLRWARFGDPRLAELRRAEVRGWLLDCSGRDDRALAAYRAVRRDSVARVYPLGPAGDNFIGGGSDDPEARDYVVDRLFAARTRRPRSLREWGQLHPAGADLGLTLCAPLVRAAWDLLRASGYAGAVVVQDVATGALLAYTATGSPRDPPLGVARYLSPGSVFKLALAAAWWELGMPDSPLPCPAEIAVGRATIANFGRQALGVLRGPEEMLVHSCNTAAVAMMARLRAARGDRAVLAVYRRLRFFPYAHGAPPPREPDFWNTAEPAWARRMTPPPGRVRLEPGGRAFDWALAAIGQGPVDVTVLGIARLVQAIGADGVLRSPTIEAEREGRPREARVLRPATARRLQRAMREVVRRGTARAAAPLLADLGGWALGGKTGTAQVPGRPDDGWFAGLVFDPRGRARYAVVVYLQGGGPGGRAPTLLAGQLARLLALGEAR